MINELKRISQGIFCFLLVIHWTNVHSAEIGEPVLEHERKVPLATLGKFCLDRICNENQFCNITFICECRSGYKVHNNECIPKAGENETCSSHEDCWGNLICINGICRRRGSNNEFVALAKICLGITVASIIIALFSSSIKFLLRNENYRSFQRQSNSSRLSTVLPRQMSRPEESYQIHDEKPPSYEECVRSMAGNPLPSPPPYIISTNPVVPPTEIAPVHQTGVVNSPSNLTVLSAQDLNQNYNSNSAVPKNSESSNLSEKVEIKTS